MGFLDAHASAVGPRRHVHRNGRAFPFLPQALALRPPLLLEHLEADVVLGQLVLLEVFLGFGLLSLGCLVRLAEKSLQLLVRGGADGKSTKCVDCGGGVKVGDGVGIGLGWWGGGLALGLGLVEEWG